MSRKATQPQQIPQVGKYIAYDRETRDYGCYYNGDFIGYASHYSGAETLLDEFVYNALTHGLLPTELELMADAADYAELMDASRLAA